MGRIFYLTGIPGQIKEKQNNDKSAFYLPRQDVLRRFILLQNLAG